MSFGQTDKFSELIYDELKGCRSDIKETCNALTELKEAVTPMLLDFNERQKKKERMFDFRSMTVSGVIAAVIGSIMFFVTN